MARFTISGDYLYTVDNANDGWNGNSILKVVLISTPDKPETLRTVTIDYWVTVETIFTMDSYLFIGSQAAMYIYDISRPEKPVKLSTTSHFKSCDPVVAYGNYAYVTLNSSIGSWCGNRGNKLLSFDISDLEKPELKDEINMESPRGLAVDGARNLLFVCDDDLVEAYDITDPTDMTYKFSSTLVSEVRGMDAYDCIAMDGQLLVVGSNGICQLSYTGGKFEFISKIDLR